MSQPQSPYESIGFLIIMLKSPMFLYSFWAWWSKTLWVYMVLRLQHIFFLPYYVFVSFFFLQAYHVFLFTFLISTISHLVRSMAHLRFSRETLCPSVVFRALEIQTVFFFEVIRTAKHNLFDVSEIWKNPFNNHKPHVPFA